MIDQHDFELGVPPEERAHLAEVADRLERGRPLPRAMFRSDLKRLLLGGGRAPGQASATRRRGLVTTYSGPGAPLLAVAGIGLAGVGPFEA